MLWSALEFLIRASPSGREVISLEKEVFFAISVPNYWPAKKLSAVRAQGNFFEQAAFQIQRCAVNHQCIDLFRLIEPVTKLFQYSLILSTSLPELFLAMLANAACCCEAKLIPNSFDAQMFSCIAFPGSMQKLLSSRGCRRGDASIHRPWYCRQTVPLFLSGQHS